MIQIEERQYRSKRPRIFLNDYPLDMSLNQGIVDDEFNATCPDMELQGTNQTNEPQPIWKSYVQSIDIKDICCDLRQIPFCRSLNTSLVSLPENETNSSAYFSGRSSSFFQPHSEIGNESHQMSFSLPDIASTDTSAYISGHESWFQASDSLEVCHYRREQTQDGIASNECRQESLTPTSPTNETKLGSHELICDLSPIAKTIKSSMTSSPIQLPTIDFDNLVEPNNLNETLERINYRLAVCGVKSPSPTKMAKKRQLMQIYVTELLKEEVAIKENALACNNVAVQSSPKMSSGTEENNKEINNGGKTNVINDISTERDIENQLIALGCNKPTLYCIAKRKQLMEEMASKTKTKSKPRFKRTISVDKSLKI